MSILKRKKIIGIALNTHEYNMFKQACSILSRRAYTNDKPTTMARKLLLQMCDKLIKVENTEYIYRSKRE